MFRKNLFALLFALSLAISFPVYAQEETSTPEPVVVSDEVPVIVVNPDAEGNVPDIIVVSPEDPGLSDGLIGTAIVVIGGILMVGIWAFAKHRGQTPAEFWQSTPYPVRAWAAPAAWEYLYDRARMTPEIEDDQQLESIAVQLGYTIETRSDGRKVLISPAAK